MYLDFEDFRPDAPRIPTAISRREGVLLSLVVHGAALLAILFLPNLLTGHAVTEAVPAPRDRQVIQFVEMMPPVDRVAPPKRPAVDSDQDRRSATRLRVPDAENAAPRLRGNTPEPRVTPPVERPAGPPALTPAPPAPVPQPQPDETRGLGLDVPPPPAPPARQAAGRLGQALQNLQQYLHGESFDNPRGGNTDQGADIQFDSMGVDFGPWLRRFKSQIENNWLLPKAAEMLKGHVVIQFYVLRNGTITDLRVVQPSSVEAFTVSALNALKLSNPTAPLPPEYPADRVLFTVTFHYNEYVREAP